MDDNLKRDKIPPLARFERHPETEQCMKLLREMERGERRSYDSLTKSAGYDVRNPRHYLQSARKALVEDGYVFECIHGWGIERLSDSGTIKHVDSRRRKARTQAHMMGNAMSTVRVDKLSRDALMIANALIAQGGAILAFAGAGAQKRLVLAQKEHPKPITAGEFAEATKDMLRRRLNRMDP